MNRRWHFLVVLLAVVVGIVVFLWPGTSREPGPELPTTEEVPAATTDELPAPQDPTAATSTTPVQDIDSTELTERAINARSVGDIETAVALFEQAIVADPDDTVALSHYGRLLTLTFSLERAIELLEKSRDLQPTVAQAWLDLATAYERAQLFQESREAQVQAQSLVGTEAIVRDEQGRFVVAGTKLD